MPRSSEDIIFAVFAVTLRKASLAHNNFSLQKYLNRCDLHIVETSRKKILFEERAYYLLNKRPMTKREAKFVKPGLPIFSKIVRKRFVTVQNRTVVMDKSEFVRILSEVSINVTNKFCVLPQNQGQIVEVLTPPLLQMEKIVDSTVRRILPKTIADSVCPSGSRLAHLYGLPKTHTERLAM